MSGASITSGTIPANSISGGLPYLDLSNNQTIGGTKTFSGNLIINYSPLILDGNFTNYVTASTNAFTKVTTSTTTTPWYSYDSSNSNALYLINGYPTLDNGLGTFATYPSGITKSVGIYTQGNKQELYLKQRFNLTPGTYQFSCYLCKTSLSATNEGLYVYMKTYPQAGDVVSSGSTFPASVSDLSTNFINYKCNFTIPTTQTYELYIGSLSRTGVNSNSMYIIASVSLTLNQSIQTLFQSTGTYVQVYSLQLTNGISATSAQIIDFSNNAPFMSGANIAAGTIPASALSGVSGSYVDLTSTQTVGGAKTFSSLLTASGGLTASATQTINFGTNAPTMSGANVSNLNAGNLTTGLISPTIISNSGIALTSSLSSYLTTSSAASTYLSQTSAASTYATQSSLSSYLTTSSAASTYATQSSLSSYLTTSNAASTYATQSSLSSYLTTSNAASTYATQSSLSSYLTTSTAATTYLTKNDASNTYISISNDNTNISGVKKYSNPIGFGQSVTSGITFGGTPSSTNLSGGVSSKIYDDGNLHLWTDDHFFIDVSGTCTYNGTPTSGPLNKLYINKYGTYINGSPDRTNGLAGTGFEFNVYGTSRFNGASQFSSSGADTIQCNNTTNTAYFYVSTNIGIGVYQFGATPVAVLWTIGSDGTFSGLRASSDRRLKENIEPMESQWANILSINPVFFDWKDSKRHDAGFIAQDVYTKYPDLIPKQFVSNNPNSTIEDPIDLSGNPIYYGLDYGRMTSFLWKGVQETMREIDSLKAENEQLKYLIHGLSQRISSLEYR